MKNPAQLTFPPGVLGPEPARLPLLARTTDFFAVAKPAGVGVSVDPLYPGVPLLLDAIVAALAAGKPQLVELGIHHVGRLHGLDVEISGVVVFAASHEAEARLRNAAGSGRFEYVFDVLSERNATELPITCDLPLARRGAETRMAVSHAAGKKCSTAFVPMEQLGGYTLWEARTGENRPHQIRLHASESGLRIPGERRYGRVPLVFLSDLKRGYRAGREPEKPLHAPLAVHLREIVLPLDPASGSNDRVTIHAPRPRSLVALRRRLQESR